MKAKIQAIVVLALVFALGVALGIYLERKSETNSDPVKINQTSHEATVSDLQTLLDLSDVQVEQIHTLLSERQQAVDELWESFRPEVQAAMRQVHSEIADLLTGSQRQKFHEWLMQRHRDNAARGFEESHAPH